jgi:ubiquinone biosynthesis protein UbiJ
MLSALGSALTPAVLARLLLLVNHVVAGEPVATARLRPHAGRSLRLQWRGEAGLLPLPPAVALRVTPAGLFELDETAPDAADLRVTIDLPPPHRLLAQWFAGERPPVAVDGDAQFAADVAWLGENLHWDIEHDLAGVIGDAPAHELLRFGRSLREGLGRAGQGLQERWQRRPGGSDAASR